METLHFSSKPSFFKKARACKYGNSYHFKIINLQYFAILLALGNIKAATQYLKSMIILKNFCEKKTFNQTIRFVFEKLLKKWRSIIKGR